MAFVIFSITTRKISKTLILSDKCNVDTTIKIQHTGLGYLLIESSDFIKLHNLRTADISHTWSPKEGNNIVRSCVSKSENSLHIGADDGEVAIIDLELEQVMFNISSAKSDTDSVSKDPGPCVLAGLDLGFIQVWSIDSNSAVRTFEAHQKSITHMHPLSTFRVLSCSRTRGVRVHDWRQGKLLCRTLVSKEAGDPDAFVVKADEHEEFVAIAGRTHIYTWKIEGLVTVGSVNAHSETISELYFSPIEHNCSDGQNENQGAYGIRMFSKGPANLVKVWELESLKGTCH